jgi:hypothetical protein
MEELEINNDCRELMCKLGINNDKDFYEFVDRLYDCHRRAMFCKSSIEMSNYMSIKKKTRSPF